MHAPIAVNAAVTFILVYSVVFKAINWRAFQAGLLLMPQRWRPAASASTLPTPWHDRLRSIASTLVECREDRQLADEADESSPGSAYALCDGPC